MIRTLAIVSAMVAASLSTSALAAQSTATTPPKPAAAAAQKQAPAMHVKVDSTTKAATSAQKTSTARHAAWTKDQVKEAQEGLTKAGLYKGKATGVVNADTRRALRAYQKQNHLPVTGRLSDSVLVRLKST